jgi:tRNA (guanine-N7-)-methyltransferase
MGHKKLIRFEELRTLKNVLQYPEGMAGKWNDFFKNTRPIVLELACGKGEYAGRTWETASWKEFHRC